MNKIELCIENAKQRIFNPKNKMNYNAYITYFAKKHNLTIEENDKIREEIEKYINKNITVLFPVKFTVNGKEIK